MEVELNYSIIDDCVQFFLFGPRLVVKVGEFFSAPAS